MRISATEGHPDYSPACVHAKVSLDGLPVKFCIHADEEAGTIECYVVEDGLIALDRFSGDAKTEVRHGVVRIDVSDSTWPEEIIGAEWFARVQTDRAAKEAEHG